MTMTDLAEEKTDGAYVSADPVRWCEGRSLSVAPLSGGTAMRPT